MHKIHENLNPTEITNHTVFTLNDMILNVRLTGHNKLGHR